MAVNWLSNISRYGSVSIYHSNLTFNTVSSESLSEAYRVRVGIDDGMVILEPLSKERVLRGDIDEHALFEIKRKSSYSRISSTGLVNNLLSALKLELKSEPLKLKTIWDAERNCLIINAKEEEK